MGNPYRLFAVAGFPLIEFSGNMVAYFKILNYSSTFQFKRGIMFVKSLFHKCISLLNRFERLLKIGNQIFNILNACTYSQGSRGYSNAKQFLIAELPVCSCGRVGDK